MWMTTVKLKYMNPFEGSARGVKNLKRSGLATGCLKVSEGVVYLRHKYGKKCVSAMS